MSLNRSFKLVLLLVRAACLLARADCTDEGRRAAPEAVAAIDNREHGIGVAPALLPSGELRSRRGLRSAANSKVPGCAEAAA